MQSPLKSELCFSARPSDLLPGKSLKSGLRQALHLAGMVILATAMLIGAPVSTAGASLVQARPETLMRTSAWEKLREFLKEEFRQRGGHLEQWPDSTIDQAPMRFVQAVYVQMGGDPSKLNLSKTPLLLQDALLLQMYLAVGGTDETETLIDELFDSRIELLWEFFVFLGGGPISE